VRAQFQGLRAEVDHWMHSQKTAAELAASSPRGSDGTGRAGDAPIVTPVAAGPYNAGVPSAGALSSGPSPAGPPPAGPSPSGPSPVAALSLAELAARVALGGDVDEDTPRAAAARTPGSLSADAGGQTAKVPFSVFQPESPPASADAPSTAAESDPGPTFAADPAHAEGIPAASVAEGLQATGSLAAEDAAVGLPQDEPSGSPAQPDALGAPAAGVAVGNAEGDRQADRKVATGDVA